MMILTVLREEGIVLAALGVGVAYLVFATSSSSGWSIVIYCRHKGASITLNGVFLLRWPRYSDASSNN